MPHNRVGACNDAAAHVALSEAWQDLTFDDVIRESVRNDGFKPIAHFDANLALVRSDQQDDAVVVLGIPETPMSAQLVAVIRDLITVERRDRSYHELALVGLLERVQLGAKLRL